eukprot:SAG31_NODE_2082_length_6484_cov_11.246245_5_plen_63_part_00
MIDMSKMLLEIIGYSNCTLADKIELVFGALTSRRSALPSRACISLFRMKEAEYERMRLTPDP